MKNIKNPPITKSTAGCKVPRRLFCGGARTKREGGAGPLMRWRVNAENCPVTFTRSNADDMMTRVSCTYGKPAGGCKAGWTHALRAPRRGEAPMGWRRVNPPLRAPWPSARTALGTATAGTSQKNICELFSADGNLYQPIP